MKRIALVLVATALAVVGCGDDDTGGTTTTVPGTASSGSIHLSGGLEGLDQTWIIEADGTVLGPDGYLGQLAADARARLEAAITAADFFDLDDEYLPDDICCDRFLYEVTITRGGETHTVTTLDAADAPESLFVLIQTFLDVARPDA